MESHESLSPQTDTAETIRSAIEEARRMGFKIKIPGHSMDKSPIESEFELSSGGAIETVKLMRTELPEAPLVTLVETSSNHERSYDLTFTTIDDKGILRRVRYNKEGHKENIEIIGPWQPKKHKADELGIYKELPEKIEPEKVAGKLLESLRLRTFKPPALISKAGVGKAA